MGISNPVNWNDIVDPYDKIVWDKLTAQFWLPEKIALTNDLPSWETLSEEEKLVTMKVFAGLTALDTLQSTVGAISLMKDALTPHEEAVFTNIAFMEAVHAKSYSSIFSTLASTIEINAAFEWARNDKHLNKKIEIVESYYRGDDPYMKKVASTLLESFLFYSGFAWPLYWSTRGKLTNTADIIKLILRDESCHGVYIGYKYQKNQDVENLSETERQELKDKVYSLLFDLYDNEVEYTQSIYEDVGFTEMVVKFLRYNANKALMNLGYEPLFPTEEVDPAIMGALSVDSENHDFFSGSGSTYVIGKHEQTADEDWDWDD